jgi:zinc protease
MMSQYETSLAHRGDNPRTVFFDEVRNTIYGNHPRLRPLELADLPKVDTATALAFIRKSLNPADYTFVFTGNLTGTMRDYVETYIGSIPRGERWNEWRDFGITRPGKVEKNVYKGREEQSRVYMAWFTPARFSEELSAASQVLNEYLDIRLNDEIREKLGGVYSISANVTASFMPQGELGMAVSFACDPARVGELSAAVISLLNQTAGIAAGAGAINQDVFTKAVEAMKKGWETSIQGNSYIAQSYANSSVLMNAPLSRLDRRPQYYSAVTPADIRRICAQLLQGNNGPAQVVLLPER